MASWLMTPKSPLYRKNAFSLAGLHLAQTKGDHVYCWLLERLKRSLVFITHLTCSLAGLHLAHAQAMDKSRNETTATSVLRYLIGNTLPQRQDVAMQDKAKGAPQGRTRFPQPHVSSPTKQGISLFY
jgi:hypothetical protein